MYRSCRCTKTLQSKGKTKVLFSQTASSDLVCIWFAFSFKRFSFVKLFGNQTSQLDSKSGEY